MERSYMNQIHLNPIKHTLENSGAVKFAYLFGSKARGTSGPLSDVEFQIRSYRLTEKKLFKGASLWSIKISCLRDLRNFFTIFKGWLPSETSLSMIICAWIEHECIK